jgi:hypothetical protein
MANPYGEGLASETIVRVLTTVPLNQELVMKRHSTKTILPETYSNSCQP